MAYKLSGHVCKSEPGFSPAPQKASAFVTSSPEICEKPGPVTQIAQGWGPVEQSSHFVALAEVRQESLTCAQAEFQKMEQEPAEFGKWLEDVAIKRDYLIIEAQAMERLASELLANQKALGKNKLTPEQMASKQAALQEAKARYESIYSSIPFGEMNEVRQLLAEEVMTESARSKPTLLSGDGKRLAEFRTKLWRARGGTLETVKKDRETLLLGIESGGASFSRSLKESLAQDEDLLAAVRERKKPVSLDRVACEVDAQYGRGAQARDQTLFIGSAVATGATLLIPKLAVAGLLGRAASGAAAGGQVSVRSSLIYRSAVAYLPATTNWTTMGNSISRACIGSSSSTKGQIKPGQNNCSQYSLKNLNRDNCVLEATLAAAGGLAALAKTQAGQKLLQYLGQQTQVLVTEVRTALRGRPAAPAAAVPAAPVAATPAVAAPPAQAAVAVPPTASVPAQAATAPAAAAPKPAPVVESAAPVKPSVTEPSPAPSVAASPPPAPKPTPVESAAAKPAADPIATADAAVPAAPKPVPAETPTSATTHAETAGPPAAAPARALTPDEQQVQIVNQYLAEQKAGRATPPKEAAPAPNKEAGAVQEGEAPPRRRGKGGYSPPISIYPKPKPENLAVETRIPPPLQARVGAKMNSLKEAVTRAVARGESVPSHKRETTVVSLLKEEEIVPKNGVIHVMGPSNSAEEWVLPLLSRPDTKIVLFELEAGAIELSRVLKDDKKLFSVWQKLREKYSGYREVLAESHVKSFEQFKNEVQSRVSLNIDFKNQTYVDSPFVIKPANGDLNVPKADMVIINEANVQYRGQVEWRGIHGEEVSDMARAQLKPENGLVWVTTAEEMSHRTGMLTKFPAVRMPAGRASFRHTGLPLEGMQLGVDHSAESALFLFP